MLHELKHHYYATDLEALGDGVIHSADYNMDDLIERGAEVFAAEFIYPAAEFADDIASIGITTGHSLVAYLLAKES